MQEIQIVCYGNPAPQGSKKALMRPGARFPSVVESSGEKLKRWRYEVAQAAAEEMRRQGLALMLGAVWIDISFHLIRPKSHFGSGNNQRNIKPKSPAHHTQKPDIDKLTRAVLDSLSGQVYRDDSQVMHLVASKHWCKAAPCVVVRVKQLQWSAAQGGNS